LGPGTAFLIDGSFPLVVVFNVVARKILCLNFRRDSNAGG
jgi:hypothetical protein